MQNVTPEVSKSVDRDAFQHIIINIIIGGAFCDRSYSTVQIRIFSISLPSYYRTSVEGTSLSCQDNPPKKAQERRLTVEEYTDSLKKKFGDVPRLLQCTSSFGTCEDNSNGCAREFAKNESKITVFDLSTASPLTASTEAIKLIVAKRLPTKLLNSASKNDQIWRAINWDLWEIAKSFPFADDVLSLESKWSTLQVPDLMITQIAADEDDRNFIHHWGPQNDANHRNTFSENLLMADFLAGAKSNPFTHGRFYAHNFATFERLVQVRFVLH